MNIFTHLTKPKQPSSPVTNDSSAEKGFLESAYDSVEATIKDLKIPETLSHASSASKEYLKKWIDSTDGFSEERVRATLLPLVNSVDSYLKKGGETAEGLYRSALQAEDRLLEFLGRSDIQSHEKPSSYMKSLAKDLKALVVMGYEKSSHVIANGIAPAIGSAIDYVGVRLLGETSYQNLKDNFLSYAHKIGEAFTATVNNLLQALFKTEENEQAKKDKEQRRLFRAESFSSAEVVQAEKAKEHVSQLVQQLKFFQATEKDFLSKNILDKEEDGILKNRPDSVRQELTAFSRPVFDPFPSYHTRETKEREKKS